MPSTHALKPSSLLIGLGVLLGLTAAVSGLADAQRHASPFDQVDGPGLSTPGFEPIFVPAAAGDGRASAPMLPPEVEGPPTQASLATAPASVALATPARREQDPAAGEGPAPTATTAPIWAPDRLVIPAIELDAPVVPAALKEIMSWGQFYHQWVAPDKKAAGWHTTSAPLGVAGNTVLNGHNNIHGEVFGHLADLAEGDLLWVYSGARAFVYRIVLIVILPERWQPLDVRLANAQWIQPSQDERLTLVTCWPYASNTHRLVIVARPVNLAAMEDYELTPRLTPHPAAP
jgi:LPXTG-site transpeptidase (sortase) family protein